jgi:hypothetical protein
VILSAFEYARQHLVTWNRLIDKDGQAIHFGDASAAEGQFGNSKLQLVSFFYFHFFTQTLNVFLL